MPDLSASLRSLIDESVPPVDVGAIVRARRRRRFRRRASVASVVVVIAAVVTGSVLARPASEPKVVSVGGSGATGATSREAAATRVALGAVTIVSPVGGTSALQSFPSAPPIDFTDPLSGTTRSIPFPVPGVLGLPVRFITQGTRVVMVVTQKSSSPGLDQPVGSPIARAYAASSSFRQWESVGDGPISSAFAALDGGVWLVTPGAQNPYVSESPLHAGGRSAGPYRITRGRTPIAAVTGGLLTRRLSGSSTEQLYEVWNPTTGKVVRVLGGFAAPVAVSASHLAWIDGVCPSAYSCSLHIGNVGGGFRIIPPPRGMQWSGSAAFSPDGTQLAIVATRSPSRQELASDSLLNSPATHPAEVAVFNAVSGQEVTRSTSAWRRSLTTTWSPDGSLVFFTRDATHVGYFDTTFADSPVHDLKVPDADSFSVLAKPAPPAPTAPRWSYNGRVLADDLHSAELCIYFSDLDLSPYSDGCGGPLVVGWSPKQVSGTFHLVGTYNGDSFTLTQPPDTPVPTTVPTTPSSSPTTSPSPPPGSRSQAELEAIDAQLFGAFGRSIGLDMVEGGPDGHSDVVDATAIAVTPAMRAAVDQRFGAGVVRLGSVLTPVP